MCYAKNYTVEPWFGAKNFWSLQQENRQNWPRYSANLDFMRIFSASSIALYRDSTVYKLKNPGSFDCVLSYRSL
jgi:hypothetical protein